MDREPRVDRGDASRAGRGDRVVDERRRARIREHAAAFGGHSIDWISVIADDVDPEEIAV